PPSIAGPIRRPGRVPSRGSAARLCRAHDRGVEDNEARRGDPDALHRARFHRQDEIRDARTARRLEYRQPLHLWRLNTPDWLSVSLLVVRKRQTVFMLTDRYDLSLSTLAA